MWIKEVARVGDGDVERRHADEDARVGRMGPAPDGRPAALERPRRSQQLLVGQRSRHYEGLRQTKRQQHQHQQQQHNNINVGFGLKNRFQWGVAPVAQLEAIVGVADAPVFAGPAALDLVVPVAGRGERPHARHGRRGWESVEDKKKREKKRNEPKKKQSDCSSTHWHSKVKSSSSLLGKL